MTLLPWIVVGLLSVPGQFDPADQDAPPPPERLDEEAPDVEADSPPAVPDPEAAQPVPPGETSRPEGPPPPPPRRGTKNKNLLGFEVMDRETVALAQFAAGLVLAGVTGAASLLSPLIVGLALVVLGDAVGMQRAPLAFGIGGAYLGQLACGLSPLLMGTAAFGLGVVGLLVALSTTFSGPFATLGFVAYIAGALAFYAGLFVAIPGGMLGNAGGGALGYYLGAEDKLAGDDEFRFPGLFDPAHDPDRLNNEYAALSY